MWRLMLTLLMALLAACTTVGPQALRGADSVANSRAANGPFLGAAEAAFVRDPVPGQWWRLYQSPVLDGLILDALGANTDLRAAAANLARAQAGLEHADAAAGPLTTIQAAPAYARRSAEDELRPGKPLSNNAVYSLALGVSYQLDLFGQVSRAIEAARADVGSARAAHDAVRVSIVAETTRAFLEVCSVRREMDVAQRSVDLQARSTELVQSLDRAGRGSSLDVTRSMAQEEQVRASLPSLQAQRRVALYRLAVLTGHVPQEFPRAVEACEQEPKLAQAIPVGDGAELLRRRPDVRRAEFEVQSAAARIGVAEGDLYPKVFLGASIGSVGLAKNFLDADTFKFSLGPLITWQFPDRSRIHARIHGAEAEQQIAIARFDGAVLNALKETESALETYARDLERRAILEKARQQAAQAARDSEQLFTLGRSGYLPVLDATRTLINVEQSLALADSKLAADQVNLFLALGGGWEGSGR